MKEGDSQRLGDLFLDATPCCLFVKLHLTSQEIVLIKIAQQEIGIGHTRVSAAFPVADGSGVGPGALRPDPEQTQRINPSNTAAAGADALYVDHFHGHSLVFNPVKIRGWDDPVSDKTDIKAGAAHVNGENVVATKTLA